MKKAVYSIFFTLALSLSVITTAPATSHAVDTDQIKKLSLFLGIMNDYFEIVNNLTDIAKDPEKSSVMQLQKLQEIYKESGDPEGGLVAVKKILEETDNLAVQNAGTFVLLEALKNHGEHEKAIKIIEKQLKRNFKELK